MMGLLDQGFALAATQPKDPGRQRDSAAAAGSRARGRPPRRAPGTVGSPALLG